jgi:anti-sigma B factor antagonist
MTTQTLSLHLAGLSTALRGASPTAFLARRARKSSAPPPFAAITATTTTTPEMKLTRIDSESECRLRIDGVLDVHSAPELRPVFNAIVAARPQHVVVDLAALTMVDSSGVGALVSLFKRVQAAGGAFAVIGVKSQPLAVFRLLRLDRVFGL